jgi:hypothetical protein
MTRDAARVFGSLLDVKKSHGAQKLCAFFTPAVVV